MNIPKELRAGDSVTWYDDATADSLGNSLSPETWELFYTFRGNGAQLDADAVEENGRWKTSISAEDSADLTAGEVYWQAYAENGDGERKTLGAGTIKILADISSGDNTFDGRSQAKKDLDAVQAAMRAMISGGAVQSYTIGNRTLQKMGMPDLIALESRLKAEVVRERKAEMIKNGLGNPHKTFVRF